MKKKSDMQTIFDTNNKETKSKKTQKNHDIAPNTSLKKTFKHIVSHTKKQIKSLKPKCKKALMKLAHTVAQELISDSPINIPRIIPVPKTGGFLPLVPIFAGLSAAGSLAGGAAGIARVINEYKTAKKQLLELTRHNKQVEAVCIGKGLHLKPFKDGLGIYVTDKKN